MKANQRNFESFLGLVLNFLARRRGRERMSALPPIADMCSATTGCPLCANSGHRTLFDHFVGASEQRGRGESEGVDVRAVRTVRYSIPQVVRRKFHDDTKRGGTCRQPAQAVI